MIPQSHCSASPTILGILTCLVRETSKWRAIRDVACDSRPVRLVLPVLPAAARDTPVNSSPPPTGNRSVRASTPVSVCQENWLGSAHSTSVRIWTVSASRRWTLHSARSWQHWPWWSRAATGHARVVLGRSAEQVLLFIPSRTRVVDAEQSPRSDCRQPPSAVQDIRATGYACHFPP